ncbi:uncharacterized protein LOC143285402 isoform X2 [Babylonia areolata]|uniref:uncharacterized protein LOC143285402 isoform X2 n=1 Tax=Babylonia areolata TaxID=304850 RepID=UPI003FD49D4E
MTRRKQNYPKRLKCEAEERERKGSTSEDNNSADAPRELEAAAGGGARGDNSPLATDEEGGEEEEEEDNDENHHHHHHRHHHHHLTRRGGEEKEEEEGGHDAAASSAATSHLLPGLGCQDMSDDGDDHHHHHPPVSDSTAPSRSVVTAHQSLLENPSPKSLLPESHHHHHHRGVGVGVGVVVSPGNHSLNHNHNHNPAGSHTATPTTPSPPTPSPLASLCGMTVPSVPAVDEGNSGAIKEEERSTPSASSRKTSLPSKNRTVVSPLAMASSSVMLPVPAALPRPVLPSTDKEKPRRTSPAHRTSGVSQQHQQQHGRRHSSFYEKMAAQALAVATSAAAAAAAANNNNNNTSSSSALELTTTGDDDDQPLDLSRKSSRPRSVSEPDPSGPTTARWGEGGGKRGKDGRSSNSSSSGKGDEAGGMSNGISSLQSLQKRFGGDFLMETPRRPSSIIPLQSTILPSKSILRPPPIPGNGLSHLSISAAAAAAAAAASSASSSSSLSSNHHHHHHQQPHHHPHHSSGATTKSKSTVSAKADRMDKMMSIATSTNPVTTVRKSEKPPDNTSESSSRKAESSSSSSSSSSKPGKSGGSGMAVGGNKAAAESEADNKYTIHRCSCQKSFGTLYALSAHLQETGHVPSSSKQQTLMDYPKLVRGQDMWLNQESEQTRRILRCMQCGESFKSLPMLTVHMMQTQHYSKIVSAEHGRRSHKCSAYCDRELDRECIFKCKRVTGVKRARVCQETYTDMEGLANHMIVSGHHKKQVLRSHNCTELALRHKHRKRFLSDEASGSTVASLLEYKRKYQGGSGGSNGYLPQIGGGGSGGGGGGSSGTATPSSSDGLVPCESCGKKIEMPWFLEHVRLCLRQKAEVIDALKVKLFGEECGGSGKPAKTSNSESKGKSSDNSLEQPLPSTRDTALFKRLNSIGCSSSPAGTGKDSGADHVHTDSQDAESKEEKAELSAKLSSQETDVNQNENDVPKCSGRESAEPSDRSEDKPCCMQSPESAPQKDEEDKACAKSKQNAASPDDKPVQEKLAEDGAESRKESKEEPGVDPGTKNGGETPAPGDRCISPRIPSPMTDEENTSERSPSPPSDPSQSEDSKPPSPAPPSPRSKPEPPPPPPSQDLTITVKRELESDEEEDTMKNHKKIKLEEAEQQHEGGGEAEESKIVQNKIKVKIPDDDSSMKGTPSPASQSSPNPLPSENRANLNGKIPRSTAQDPSLDIIDPNSEDEPAKESGSSALKAMESFIQRSFSSKFDSRRNTMSAGFGSISGPPHMPPMLNMSRGVPRSSASPSTSASPAASSMSYLSQFSRFLSPVQPSSSKYLDIGKDSPLPSFEKNVLSSLSAKSAELLEKTRNPIRDMASMKPVSANGLTVKPTKGLTKTKSATATSQSMDDDDKEKESDEERDEKKGVTVKEADQPCKAEDLATKYLNLDEEENREEKGETDERGSSSSSKGESSKGSGKKSALDSLSSFVYGQPMTSEHPLDSLQKLLTKTSIPKVMSAAVSPFPHFSPHHYPYLTEQMMERMCFTPPDLPSSSSPAASAMPLNLSLKPGAGGGSSSDDEDPASSHQDCDSPSALRDPEDGNQSSPGAVGPDGELTEFKCAACSRRFASKGSYRYHLSRCHLSSVKKYGIKEAFNMSPYVYLPLDHTAKFTKYYQMAQELASKGK